MKDKKVHLKYLKQNKSEGSEPFFGKNRLREVEAEEERPASAHAIPRTRVVGMAKAARRKSARLKTVRRRLKDFSREVEKFSGAGRKISRRRKSGRFDLP